MRSIAERSAGARSGNVRRALALLDDAIDLVEVLLAAVEQDPDTPELTRDAVNLAGVLLDALEGCRQPRRAGQDGAGADRGEPAPGASAGG